MTMGGRVGALPQPHQAPALSQLHHTLLPYDLASHIRAFVQLPAVSLPVQLVANAIGKVQVLGTLSLTWQTFCFYLVYSWYFKDLCQALSLS